MRHLLHRINRLLVIMGFDFRKTIHFFKGMPFYLRDLRTLKNQKSSEANEFPFRKSFPCLGDRFAVSGSANGHYFHQDLLVARRIYINNPQNHVDIGSRVDGFIAHVASFRQIKVLDIRSLTNTISNVSFIQADLMTALNNDLIDSCDSLSCLHALEHFGLGRYGDSVNYNGYLIGLNNLWKILNKGGKLYFSVPIGPQRIEFNAHRVFSVDFLLEKFSGKYHIDQFSFVDDHGDLHENIPLTDSAVKDSFDCIFGCGIFEMTKL